MRFLSITVLAFSLLFPTALVAATKFDVAIISDDPNQQLNLIGDVLKDELLALTEGEFEVTLKRYEADWTLGGYREGLSAGLR